MQPHEQRVVDEKRELDGKLEQLTVFTSSSPIFIGLHPIDQDLLIRQRIAMTDYSETLGSRIARFVG